MKLKDFFDAGVVRSIAAQLRGAHRRFDETAFIRECLRGLPQLELTERAWHVAEAMRRHLPDDFADAARVIVASLGPELDRTEGFGLAPLFYMPHVFFVGKYGLHAFEPSMQAQYELTKRFSAEWSIRAFLIRHPGATYERLQTWVRDPSVHVRRLVSEGTRPRLPWAPRLRAFQEDPRPVLRLLESLKDDPERYVQRSVANNLNDIGKDHPALAVEVCRRWSQGAPAGRRWIVGHALRSLVKKGDRTALATLGFAGKPAVAVKAARFEPPRLALGQVVRFSFDLVSRARRPQELLVDYAVHFVRRGGAARPKVFKLRKLSLPAGGTVRLESRVSMAHLTTRKPLPGRHAIDVLVNGVAFPLGAFDVYPPKN
jgi:3-methyladenine DNA glycosylase AlkC